MSSASGRCHRLRSHRRSRRSRRWLWSSRDPYGIRRTAGHPRQCSTWRRWSSACPPCTPRIYSTPRTSRACRLGTHRSRCNGSQPSNRSCSQWCRTGSRTNSHPSGSGRSWGNLRRCRSHPKRRGREAPDPASVRAASQAPTGRWRRAFVCSFLSYYYSSLIIILKIFMLFVLPDLNTVDDRSKVVFGYRTEEKSVYQTLALCLPYLFGQIFICFIIHKENDTTVFRIPFYLVTDRHSFFEHPWRIRLDLH